MRLVKVLKQVRNDYQGVYECEKCHGIRIDKGLDSYSDRNYRENVIPKMPCYLCDDAAPLSKRYWMALCTVVWACQPHGEFTPTEEHGFPSFTKAYTDKNNICYITLSFDSLGYECEAGEVWANPKISWNKGLFDLIVDGKAKGFDQMSLAQQVVDMCLRDLRAKYEDKEAE
ncbi:hypothetical protein CRD60_01020 [Bifidobacterium aemilianum]|uniref:Uncharacterized protein n=1 Tax=Bifidobacterium aemilianum TaxID=2493120 RepID=A0A366KBC3_9BIFI|nr:hypothetical protein [Bifidobacterium aemilianum]RBP98478.1 hypothetical protein CRD60_01020 [Bifidobacterium aemilianum]